MTKINTYKIKKYKLKTRNKKYKLKTRNKKYKIKKGGGPIATKGAAAVSGVGESAANMGIASLEALSTLMGTSASAITKSTTIFSVAVDDALGVAQGVTETIGVLGDAIAVANLTASVALLVANKTLTKLQEIFTAKAKTVCELYNRYDNEKQHSINIRIAYKNFLDTTYLGFTRNSKERVITITKKNYADENLAYSYMKQLGCSGFGGYVSCGFSVKHNTKLNTNVKTGGANTNTKIYTGTQVKNIYENIKRLNRDFLRYVQTMDVKTKNLFISARQQIETIRPGMNTQRPLNDNLLGIIVKFMESNSISIYVGDEKDLVNTTFLGHENLVNNELEQLVIIIKHQKKNKENTTNIKEKNKIFTKEENEKMEAEKAKLVAEKEKLAAEKEKILKTEKEKLDQINKEKDLNIDFLKGKIKLVQEEIKLDAITSTLSETLKEEEKKKIESKKNQIELNSQNLKQSLPGESEKIYIRQILAEKPVPILRANQISEPAEQVAPAPEAPAPAPEAPAPAPEAPAPAPAAQQKNYNSPNPLQSNH